MVIALSKLGGGSGVFSTNLFFCCRIFSLGYNYCPVHTEIYGTYRARYFNPSGNCHFLYHVLFLICTMYMLKDDLWPNWKLPNVTWVSSLKLRGAPLLHNLCHKACSFLTNDNCTGQCTAVDTSIRERRCKLISTNNILGCLQEGMVWQRSLAPAKTPLQRGQAWWLLDPLTPTTMGPVGQEDYYIRILDGHSKHHERSLYSWRRIDC